MVKSMLLVAAAIIIAAVALDLAVFLARANKAQWEAEGMATAAARQLSLNSDQASARIAADNWLARNYSGLPNADCCVFADRRPLAQPDGHADTVTASASVSQTTLFLHYLGLPRTFSMKKSATAQVAGAMGAPVCPWGIIGDESATGGDGGSYFGLAPGRVYTFDLGGSATGTGDLVPLDLTRAGISGYERAIAAGCRKEETGVWSVGDSAGVLPGGADTAAATLRALEDHYVFESGDGVSDYLGLDWCDITFQNDADGLGQISGFNPYVQIPRAECVRGTLDGGAGRLVVVPIISRQAAGGDGSVRILGLASMYIAGWDRGRGAGERLYGVFFDRTRLNNVNLVGSDDNPLAPLRIALLK